MILELRLSTVSSYCLSDTILNTFVNIFDFKFECHLNEKIFGDKNLR
jgi:hypothetical protein